MRVIGRVLPLLLLAISLPAFAGWKVLAWNDLGMHCTDGVDFSVFAVLPPYNTIHAQVIDANGKLVTSGTSVKVTYEAVADSSGSINTTSASKTNFWTYAGALFGATLASDSGLAGKAMPGKANVPQAMDFEAAAGWFTATGIPVTPYDDAGRKNYYPMMRIVARDANGQVLASTNIVLPVSDEMDCARCHSNGKFGGADLKSVKLNILSSHDTFNAGAAYKTALAQAGYRSDGLLATAQNGTPVLCAKCHSSNALGTAGYSGIPSLTASMHAFHAAMPDPETGTKLGDSSDRSSCYRCHPGAATKCLRGVMGRAVESNAQLAIQCQDCHGSMSEVGSAARAGWLQEPTCQSCHIGNAAASAGQMRFMSAFTSAGVVRTPVDSTFATNSNAPSPGISLYRFSRGHGNLYCEACHGSTHAELPSFDASDNAQAIALQGHAGVIAECTACHASPPSTTTGGPHGMHPLGTPWVSAHSNVAEHGSSQCQACHGTDYRGTVLSRAAGDRTLSAFGTKNFWRGFRISCYACHNGPSSESTSKILPPSVSNASMAAYAGTTTMTSLSASDPAGTPLTLHIVQPPLHGTAAISGQAAIYIADPAFSGNDSFTFAAWNGSVESNLGTVKVTVSGAGQRRRVAGK